MCVSVELTDDEDASGASHGKTVVYEVISL